MAKTNIKVSFIRTTTAKYAEYKAANSLVAGAIYFVESEYGGTIYMDGKVYGESKVTPVGYEFITKDTGNTGTYLQVTWDNGAKTQYGPIPGADGAKYTAGDGIIISDENVISADMDYISENTKVKDEITVTENVGGYSAGETVAADTKVLDVLKKMLCQEKQPTITSPTMTLSMTKPYIARANGTAEVEIGTVLTPQITAIAQSLGKYEFGPDPTGAEVTEYTFYMPDPTDSTKTSWDQASYETNNPKQVHTMNSHTIGDKKWVITVYMNYSDGNDALTNLGNVATKKLTAGRVQGNLYIKGIRNAFYGSLVTPLAELNSANIRSLNAASSNGLTTLVVPVTAGSKQVIIAVPAEKTVTSIVDTGLANSEVIDTFTKSTVSVEGANGYTAVDYNVYIYNSSTALGTNTYNVILK